MRSPFFPKYSASKEHDNDLPPKAHWFLVPFRPKLSAGISAEYFCSDTRRIFRISVVFSLELSCICYKILILSKTCTSLFDILKRGFQRISNMPVKETVHRAIRHLSPFYWPFYAGLRFHTTKANKYLSWRNTWHDYFPWYVSFAQKAALKALTAIFQRPVARQKYK